MSCTLFTLTYENVPYYLPGMMTVNPVYDAQQTARENVARNLRAGLLTDARSIAAASKITITQSAPVYTDAVLSTQQREARMSDYSDYYWTFTVWTGTEVKEVHDQYVVPEAERYAPGTQHVCVWTVDEDAETTGPHAADIAAWRAEKARVAELYTEARKFVAQIETPTKFLSGVCRDRNCSVVKGRKVPKGGGYRVTYVGSGQFGDFANILGPDGKEYKFVSLSNLVREVEDGEVKPYQDRFWGVLADDRAKQIAARIIKGDADGWGVLADLVQELRGDEFGGIFRHQVKEYVR
jgi:hypothetical protein